MYVKNLTMRGFKSFAGATTLRLEPGITAIVGPNGSGKSNVVDALAWVMGEQGAKSLRGGKMEDVIFAGTSGRPPLGRAEVALTIDNSDGALPIDYTEVTISRTMFRNGGSDYAINGTGCRLLDIQELLSDSGIGREMHVIVGQGQLDTVLRATPEERRGFIEEAAGVLKHRKRKERALRKLETMDASLVRLHDLTTEIRRQLGPLSRQAETARKAAVIQADARDARARLLADDLVQLSSTLAQEVADETALTARRVELEAIIGESADRLALVESRAAEAGPDVSRAQARWFSLSQLADRLATLGQVAGERVRLLREDAVGPAPDSGRDPEVMRAQAAELQAQAESSAADIRNAAEQLDDAVRERAEAEAAFTAEQTRLAVQLRASADRREGMATLAGRVAAMASRIEAAEAEIGRLDTLHLASVERATVVEREFAALESSIAADEEGERGLDAAYDDAVAALEALDGRLERLRNDERSAESERATWTARHDALTLSLKRNEGAAALLADGGDLDVSDVVSVLTVSPGHESVVAAALGWIADGLVVIDASAAARAMQRLRDQGSGGAGFLVGVDAPRRERGQWADLPAGAVWVRDLVSTTSRYDAALTTALENVVLASDAGSAVAFVAADSRLVAVTADGDVHAHGLVRGGVADTSSALEITRAATEAAHAAGEATARVEQARFARRATEAQRHEAAERVEAALELLHESDAAMASVAERLGALGSALRVARAEAARTHSTVSDLRVAMQADRQTHLDLAERLVAAQEAPDVHDPSTDERDRLDEAARAARATETELRLALRTREERARAVTERAETLRASAEAEVVARARYAERRARRAAEAETAAAARIGAEEAKRIVSEAAGAAAVLRTRAEEERAARDIEAATLRRELAAGQAQLRELTDIAHRDEVARAQQQMRIEALETRARDELGIDPAVLVEEFGPHQLVPRFDNLVAATAEGVGVVGVADGADAVSGAEPDDGPAGSAYVRVEQEKRLRVAERQLSALGRVNPLALEEFAALEERHAFLQAQVEDLTRSRADLLDIVQEVDERVERVFTDAYLDTAAQFERVFARLFPGGEGRLVLTDPDNMLTTGIEVEARPPGKKIKRLSLLSGGERSLTAVALLVAIFKARPSPFYIMDEVEAALDDTNLGRLIILLEELRDSSQLIVITHQKRTMEIADALYGVTMRGDGVTTVVSQRIRELASTSS